MDVAIQAGNFDKAKELLKKEKTDDYYYQAKLDQREIEIAIQENQMETALEKTNQALEKYKTGEKKEQEEFPDEDFYLSGMTDIEENLLSIQKSVQRAVSKDASNVGTVTGKITKLGGTPVSHAGVFLRKQGDVNRSVSRLEPYQTKTDRHGNYSIDGVVPGSYQLSLGFDFSQIDGYTWPVDMDDWIDVAGERGIDYDVTLHPLMEITSPVNEEKITGQQVNFSWMAVENAAYYELHLNVEFEGGSMSTVFQSHIKNNQLTVPMEKLYQHEISRILPDDDLKYRSVGQLLGLTDPDSRYAWSVQAYNAKDELITKSDGYRLNEDTIGDLPFFYLKGRKMTAADDLLREGKFKKALEAYQIAYEKDSSDMHSLQMITRLINLEGSPEDIWETEKAIPYVKAFVEKTKNPQAINRLMDYYKSERNWEAFHQYFSLYKQVHKGQIDVYDSQMYAQALMEEGRLREAEQIFMETEKKDKSHRFIGNLLAVKLYQGTSFQEVEQLAVDFPQRSFGGWDDPDWLKLIRDLRENGEGDDNYRKKLNTALDAYFTGDEAAMKGIVDPVIKQFIEAEKGVK
jgi:tetratricopeptide (TPR) repeat protein